MRKKYFIPLSTFALILITILAFVFIDKMWNAARSCVCRGTVSATHAGLTTEFYKEETKLREVFGQISEHWQFLTDEQYDHVITELSKFYSLDPPKNWDRSKPLLDPWGNRFRIKCKSEDKIYMFIVLSKGRDGIDGTKDDIWSGWY